jgi:hypothetical protein
MTNKLNKISVVAVLGTLAFGISAYAGQAERERMEIVNKLANDNQELLTKDCKTPLTIGVDWGGFADVTAMKYAYEGVGHLIGAVEGFCNGNPGNQQAIHGKLTRLVLRFGHPGGKLDGKSLVCVANQERACDEAELAHALAKF